MDIASLKEHADVIALLGGCYFVWSAKRILNKLESSIESLTKAVDECDSTCEQRTSDIYTHLNSVRQERDKQINGIIARINSARELRDEQISKLREDVMAIKTAHKHNHGVEP